MASDASAGDHLNPDDEMDALATAEAEEAEAEAALAQARAHAARVRADRLRREAEQAEAAKQAEAAEEVGPPPDNIDPDAPTEPPADLPAPRRRLMPSGTGNPARRALWKPVSVAAAVALVAVLLGLSGLLTWRQHDADQRRQLAAEYSAVARQGVVNLMSLSHDSAQDDIARVIDNSTGRFKEEFEAQSQFLIEALQQSGVVTDVTVDALAVESSTKDSAVVLVVARSQASNSDDERRQPQRFRMAVGLARDGDQLKISQVDFI